jgi:hypothetical protein
MDIRLAFAFLLASCAICGDALCQSALSPENAKNLRDTVTGCVKLVKSSTPPKSVTNLYGPSAQLYFGDFDAFYNPATGRVENNAQIVAMQPPLFLFNKCMAEHGWPLK